MRTASEVEGSLESIRKHVGAKPSDVVEVIPYGGMDKRIGWDTYLVVLNGVPWGMTDGPAKEAENETK